MISVLICCGVFICYLMSHLEILAGEHSPLQWPMALSLPLPVPRSPLEQSAHTRCGQGSRRGNQDPIQEGKKVIGGRTSLRKHKFKDTILRISRWLRQTIKPKRGLPPTSASQYIYG